MPDDQRTAQDGADGPLPSSVEVSPAASADGPGSVRVGLVLGTQEATPLAWWVAVSSDAYLQLDDVVSVESHVPGAPTGRERVVLSGVVSQVLARHEGARYEGDVFLSEGGMFPIELARSARITTTRMHHPGLGPHVPVLTVPPLPGSSVRRADEDERERALHFDEMTEGKVPAGFGRDGKIVFIDASFVDGRRGGHINISGISGVATKTSYALYLIYAMLNAERGGGKALSHPANARVVIFNVKGEDLLWLSKPNRDRDPATDAEYRALGLTGATRSPGPFGHVRIWTPQPRTGKEGAPGGNAQHEDVATYYWTLREFVKGQLLGFMFTETGDERSQIADLIDRVSERLAREGRPVRDGVPPHDTERLDDIEFDEQTEDAATGELQEITRVKSFSELVAFIERRLSDPNDNWRGVLAGGTVDGFLRRLHAAARAVGHLVRGSADGTPNVRDHRIESLVTDSTGTQTAVVDIHALNDRAKRFVVGAVMAQLVSYKEDAGGGADHPVFIVLDELNKYAPREGSSPIKEVLLDIAERGRSMGLILIGAQQTASEVSRRIVSNASVRVVGRMDAAEVERPEYGYMDATARQRSLLLTSGSMLLLQPRVPVPIEVRFPFPAWATRRTEVATDTAAGSARLAAFKNDPEA